MGILSFRGREARGAETLEAGLRVGTRYGRRIIGANQSGSESAQRLLAVWGCVRLVADTISTMPWGAIRPDGADRAPIDPPKLLMSPDGGLPESWKRKVLWSAMIAGNAYGLVTETTKDYRYPTRIDLRHPDHVSWTVDQGVEKPVIDGKVHELWPIGDVWHFPAYEKPETRVGMNPIQVAATVVGMGSGSQNFANDFFEADARPSGILRIKAMISAADAEKHKAKAREAMANRDFLVVGNDVDWESMQVSPTDSQFLDTMRYTSQQICGALFGVPPELLGYATSGSSVTYVNAADRDSSFLKYGLSPWITRLEKAMSVLLPGAQTVKVNDGNFLKLNLPGRMAVYLQNADVYSKSGKPVFTNDEIRALEDKPPLPDDYPLPPVRAHNPLSPNATEDINGITP